MESIQPDILTHAIGKITDPGAFEAFSQSIMGVVLGKDFIPIGGVHDGAMDGLEHCFFSTDTPKLYYQASLEHDPKAKITKTLKALKRNKIRVDNLTYVCRDAVPNQDALCQELYEEFKINVQIKDCKWIALQIIRLPEAHKIYETHVAQNLHQYQMPGKVTFHSDFIEDPTIYTFLRQQLDKESGEPIEERVADALIIFALRDTDPDEGKFLTPEQIVESLQSMLGREIVPELDSVRKRLKALSDKPRKVNSHPCDKYCLPHTTREEIAAQNIHDESLSTSFFKGAEARLSTQLKTLSVKVMNLSELLSATLHEIFFKQGQAFSDFIVEGKETEELSIRLSDVVSEVVDKSRVIPKNRAAAKTALMNTLRDIVYRGTEDEKAYLSTLSLTYTLFFAVRCNPSVSLFMRSVANELMVFVDNSIIVPALSEYFLENRNRRFWRLLKEASAAGTRLIISGVVLEEAISHLKRVNEIFYNDYSNRLDDFQDDMDLTTVPEILIRAFLYERIRGYEGSFRRYLNNFVTINGVDPVDEFREFLTGEFGMEYMNTTDFPDVRGENDYATLVRALSEKKTSPEKAKNDARVILGIYKLREDGAGSGGIRGHRQWWLSTDTRTHKAVTEVFGDRFGQSCSMRPDFLHRYVSMMPQPHQVRKIYEESFCGMLGVSLSYYLPQEVNSRIIQFRKEHGDMTSARRRAAIRTLTNELMADAGKATGEYVDSFFERIDM